MKQHIYNAVYPDINTITNVIAAKQTAKIKLMFFQ